MLQIDGQQVRSLDDARCIAETLRNGSVASLSVRDPELGETIINYRGGRLTRLCRCPDFAAA